MPMELRSHQVLCVGSEIVLLLSCARAHEGALLMNLGDQGVYFFANGHCPVAMEAVNQTGADQMSNTYER